MKKKKDNELVERVNADTRLADISWYKSSLSLILDIHFPCAVLGMSKDICYGCSDIKNNYYVFYPCKTIKAMKKGLK